MRLSSHRNLGEKRALRFREKGRKDRVIPVRHDLEELSSGRNRWKCKRAHSTMWSGLGLTHTFEVSVYKSGRAFCIPKADGAALGINSGDSVHLIIKSQSGIELFRGRKSLRSGPEIYGKDIADALTPGTTIIVEASEPITLYRTPSEHAADVLTEGNRISILVNRFERNRKARAACIEAFGTACQVCGFDFGKCYGPLGQGFINVHHLTPVSQFGTEYVVEPKNDLRPVCPNCHEMLHTGEKSPSIEELKEIIENRRASD